MTFGLLISVVLTRLLSVSEYGDYRYLFTIFIILSFFSLPSSTNAIIRFVPQGFDWSYISLTNLRIKFSLLGSGFFLCVAIIGIFYEKIDNPFIFLIFAICFPIFNSMDLFEYFLQAKIKFKKLNYLQVLRAFIRLTLTIFICWLTRSAIYTLITFIIVTCIFNLVSYFYIKFLFKIKNCKKEFEIDEKKVKSMAINLSLVGLLPMVSTYIDKIAIAKYINTESLAIFTIGILLGETVNGFFKGLLSTLNPKLVHYKIKRWHYFTIFFTGTFFGLVISYIMPLVINFLYGHKYINSAIYAKIIFLSLGIHLVVILYHNQLLFNKNKPLKTLYYGESVISVIKIILILLFITIPETNEGKLIMLALMYPIKNILTGVVFFISEKIVFSKLNVR